MHFESNFGIFILNLFLLNFYFFFKFLKNFFIVVKILFFMNMNLDVIKDIIFSLLIVIKFLLEHPLSFLKIFFSNV